MQNMISNSLCAISNQNLSHNTPTIVNDNVSNFMVANYYNKVFSANDVTVILPSSLEETLSINVTSLHNTFTVFTKNDLKDIKFFIHKIILNYIIIDSKHVRIALVNSTNDENVNKEYIKFILNFNAFKAKVCNEGNFIKQIQIVKEWFKDESDCVMSIPFSYINILTQTDIHCFDDNGNVVV